MEPSPEVGEHAVRDIDRERLDEHGAARRAHRGRGSSRRRPDDDPGRRSIIGPTLPTAASSNVIIATHPASLPGHHRGPGQALPPSPQANRPRPR
jgi:hypothetical protein